MLENMHRLLEKIDSLEKASAGSPQEEPQTAADICQCHA